MNCEAPNAFWPVTVLPLIQMKKGCKPTLTIPLFLIFILKNDLLKLVFWIAQESCPKYFSQVSNFPKSINSIVTGVLVLLFPKFPLTFFWSNAFAIFGKLQKPKLRSSPSPEWISSNLTLQGCSSTSIQRVYISQHI